MAQAASTAVLAAASVVLWGGRHGYSALAGGAEIGPQANGKSLKEQVNRLEARLDHIYTILLER